MKKNQIPTKDAILVHLKSGITNLKFEKKDGELRETNPNPHGGNPDLVVCWDVDQVGWRSFNVSSLKEYNGKVQDV
jgi:hypothetical protein